MLNSIVVILVGVIVFLVGLVVSISEGFESETYWIGVGLLLGGIAIIAFFGLGKFKKWF